MDESLTEIHRELGITPDHVSATRLVLHKQPEFSLLRVVDIDFEGKPFVLLYEAAEAWSRMLAANHLRAVALVLRLRSFHISSSTQVKTTDQGDAFWFHAKRRPQTYSCPYVRSQS